MMLFLYSLTVLFLIGSFAFGVQLNSLFKKVRTNGRARNSIGVFAETSRTRCAVSCSASKGCHGFSFNDDSCEFASINSSVSLESQIEASPGFNFYYAGKISFPKKTTFYLQKREKNDHELFTLLRLINVEV